MADIDASARHFVTCAAPTGTAVLRTGCAREGVVSWNTLDERGLLEFRLLSDGSAMTPWLPYAQWSPQGRRSFSMRSDTVKVEVDFISSQSTFDAIEVRAPGVDLQAVSFASPIESTSSLPYAAHARILDVPARSQYALPGERGWCSAATLSMIHAYHGIDHDVAAVARAIYDDAYRGTGNWSMNVAFSGSLGLRAAVVFLRNLDHAQRLIDLGLPLGISYGWERGELPHAPIEHSDGHLVVLCGFTENGDCAINDPANPRLRVVYPRASIERLWQRARCPAYAIAPVGIDFVPAVNS